MLKADAIRMGTPTVITLRNEDNVTHGFVSAMFVKLPVRGEGGIPVSADGRAGFHVDPGQILTIRFTPDQSGTLDFQCDIHPNMKGELLYLEVQPSRHR
jgi:plastocyanin